MEWVREQGCIIRGCIFPIRSQLSAHIKRGRMLLEHLDHAHERERHAICMWYGHDRPRCVTCRGYGYAARPGGFLQEKCLASLRLSLNADIDILQSRLEATANLYRLLA